MAGEFKTRGLEYSDDLMLRRQTIKINGKSVETPIKAMPVADMLKIPAIPKESFNQRIFGINEIWKEFTGKSLGRYMSDRENELNLAVNKIVSSRPEKEVNIMFTEFKESRYPTMAELRFLANFTHEYSDVLTLPLTPETFKDQNSKGEKSQKVLVVSEEKFKRYLDFLKESISTYRVQNNKPIMAVIPESLPSPFLLDLIKFYSEQGINGFCYDFNGKVYTGLKTKLRQFLISLSENDLLESSFIYAINLNTGRLKEENITPAKDVLAFPLGFDSFGQQHIRPKLPSEVWTKIKAEKKPDRKKFNVFNREDYGYHAGSKLADVMDVFPKNSAINMDALISSDERKRKILQNLLNAEQKSLEALKLQEVVEDSKKNSADYVSSKKQVRSDVRNLKKLRKEVKI